MSSRNEFIRKAQDFQSAIDKYQVGEQSIAQISKFFNDFILCAKELFENEDKTKEDINLSLESIHMFLKCAIDYAGVGSASFKLTHFRVLCSKISRAIDYLDMKYYFLRSLSIQIFEILLDPDLQNWIAKEILKLYCVIVHHADRSVRTSIVKDNFSYYMSRFMDLIPFGDYEFQVLIVATLFRLYSNEELQGKEDIFFFKTEEQKRAFYSIDEKKFDFSLRLYLNLVNEKEKNVISVLCHKVCLDEFHLRELDELSGFKGLWIDFNIKHGTITFYIDNRDFCDVASPEIITIFSENISNAEISVTYNEENRREEAIGKLKLKDSCSMLKTLSQKLSNCRTLTLYSTNVKRLKEIFHRDIPKMTKKLKTKQMYTSLNRREPNSTHQPQSVQQSTNYSGSGRDSGIPICIVETETKGRNGANSEKRDLSEQIEKSKFHLFGTELIEDRNETYDANLTTNNFRLQNDKVRDPTREASNSVVISNITEKLRRGKLYNPDDPEGTMRNLPEFMEISRQNEINKTSSLGPIYNTKSKKNIINKPEIEVKLQKQPKTLSKTEHKKLVENSLTKTKKSIAPKKRESIKTTKLKNKQQSDNKDKFSHKHSGRLDILFDKVLAKWKSGNEITESSSLAPRSKKYDNNIEVEGEKYDLNLSMIKINEENMEKKRVLGRERHVRRKGNNDNNSGRNNSREEGCIDINTQEDDRDLRDFMRALCKISVKLGSGQLTVRNTAIKKKLIALSQLLLDF